MNIVKSIIILSALIFFCPTISFADIPQKIIDQKKAVVTIIIKNLEDQTLSNGSGFIIESNGLLLTNYHVISKVINNINNKIEIKLYNGSYLLKSKIVYYDEDNDIALIKSEAVDLPCANINYLKNPNQGETIYVIGSPLGIETTLSEGIISNINDKLIQITAPVSKGSSGSPLFNNDGEVIGIVKSSITEGQNINFALDIKIFKKSYETSKFTNKSSASHDINIIKNEKIIGIPFNSEFVMIINMNSAFKQIANNILQRIIKKTDFIDFIEGISKEIGTTFVLSIYSYFQNIKLISYAAILDSKQKYFNDYIILFTFDDSSIVNELSNTITSKLSAHIKISEKQLDLIKILEISSNTNESNYIIIYNNIMGYLCLKDKNTLNLVNNAFKNEIDNITFNKKFVEAQQKLDQYSFLVYFDMKYINILLSSNYKYLTDAINYLAFGIEFKLESSVNMIYEFIVSTNKDNNYIRQINDISEMVIDNSTSENEMLKITPKNALSFFKLKFKFDKIVLSNKIIKSYIDNYSKKSGIDLVDYFVSEKNNEIFLAYLPKNGSPINFLLGIKHSNIDKIIDLIMNYYKTNYKGHDISSKTIKNCELFKLKFKTDAPLLMGKLNNIMIITDEKSIGNIIDLKHEKKESFIENEYINNIYKLFSHDSFAEIYVDLKEILNHYPISNFENLYNQGINKAYFSLKYFDYKYIMSVSLEVDYYNKIDLYIDKLSSMLNNNALPKTNSIPKSNK